jgi:hypothetical protein
MSQTSNATTNIATLKELYSDDAWVMKSLILNRNPALALFPRDESPSGMGGKYFTTPVLVQSGAGRSASYGSAGTYATAPVTQEFEVTRVTNYSNFQITGDFLRASAEEIGAFMPGAELNLKASFAALGNDMALSLFGDGSGTRGTYGLGNGSIATGVITLDNVSQAMFFTIGMALTSFSVSGLTPTQSTGLALGYVIAVDTGAGTITVSATAGGAAGNPSGWSTSFPYLSQVGDTNFISNGLASANMLKWAGLLAWLPLTTTPIYGDTSYFTVNRSAAPSSLMGLRFNASNESIQDGLIDAVNTLAALGTEVGDPDFIFLNPVSFQTLVKQLTAQGVYQMVHAKINDEVNISFKALVLPTANGEISILQDRNCPAQTAFIVNTKTWKIRSNGKLNQYITWPGFYDQLGVPVAGQDAISVTVGNYSNVTCNAPAANAVVTLSQ